MYYIENISRLGETKALIYANKYLNNVMLGCDYSCKRYKIFCPEIVKNPIVPDFFKKLIDTEF